MIPKPEAALLPIARGGFSSLISSYFFTKALQGKLFPTFAPQFIFYKKVALAASHKMTDARARKKLAAIIRKHWTAV